MVKTDLTIKKRDSNNFYDILIDEDGDIETTEGLDTALKLSVFAEKRASDGEIADSVLRRGWWGNLLSIVPNYEMGSKLWLLEQARLNQFTINSSQDFAQDGCEWLIEDNIVDNILVSSQFTDIGISITIELLRFQTKILTAVYDLWENTA